jgi:hypothetical protein
MAERPIEHPMMNVAHRAATSQFALHQRFETD